MKNSLSYSPSASAQSYTNPLSTIACVSRPEGCLSAAKAGAERSEARSDNEPRRGATPRAAGGHAQIIISVCIGLILAVIPFGRLQAQQLPVFNHYTINGVLYNPAYTGIDTLGNIFLNHRQQWTSVPYAPVTEYLTVDAPIDKQKMGVGGFAYLDRTHIIQKLGISLNYAYHVNFTGEGSKKQNKLSVGLSVGFVNQRLTIDENTLIEDEYDIAIVGSERAANAFDAGFGINYRYRGLNLGFSMPQMLGSKLSYKDVAAGPNASGALFTLSRHMYGRASYEFKFGKKREISVEPGIMIRHVSNIPLQIDVNAWFRHKRGVWTGVGYRLGNDAYGTSGIHFSLGAQVLKMISFTATYEGTLDPDNRISLGHTVEAQVGIRFGGVSRELEKLRKMIMMADDQISIDKGKIDVVKPKVEEDDKPMKNAKDNKTRTRVRVINEDTNRKNREAMNKSSKNLKSMEERMIASGLDSIATITNGRRFKTQDTLESISFSANSSSLNDLSRNKLNKVVEILSNRKTEFTIILYGNAHEEATPELNMVLALQRAKSVMNYLKSKGIDKLFTVTVANGDDNILNLQDSPDEDLRKFRKVDIVIGD